MRLPDWMRDRVRDEQALSLVEIMVALLVMTVGLLAVGAGLLSAKRSTFSSQRHAVGVHQAESALEQMRGIDFAQLALKPTPAVDSPPNDPIPSRVIWGTYLQVRTAPQLLETLAFSATGAVVPREPFDVNGVTGWIRRYVTLRGSCFGGAGSGCVTTDQTKRITVAVSLDPAANGARPTAPIVFSSTVAPGPDGTTLAPVGGSQADKDQVFYLYDSACDSSSWAPAATAPVAHPVHDTAAKSSTADTSLTSSCWTTNTMSNGVRRAPDLMGTKPPTAGAQGGALPTSLPPRFGNDSTYSATENPGGIALTRSATAGCASQPTTYTTTSTGITTAANRNRVHRWVTGPFSQPFAMSGAVTLNLRTHLTGNPGTGISNGENGAVCISLFRWHEDGSLSEANDVGTAIASGICGPQNSWPQKSYGSLLANGFAPNGLRPELPCTLYVNNRTIPKGDRLALAVSVPSESNTGVNVFFDDPDTPTSLRVTTVTPCKNGGPCPAG